MMLLLKLAFRNLTRNRTRTILNLTMAIGAFTAIVLFRGFSNYMLSAMAEGLTKGQTGHIQIASHAVWTGDLPEKKEDAYIQNQIELRQQVEALPGILRAGGRANVPVLLSNGDRTIGAMAWGFDPAVEPNVEQALQVTAGQGFSKKSDYEVLVSSGLQTNLQLKIGQTLSVVSQSLAGAMSSIDLEVRGIVSSSFTDVDNSIVYIPLAAAQNLLETQRVEKIAVLLKPDVPLDSALRAVQGVVKADSSLRAQDWQESAVLFKQVNDFYKVQNLVVGLILLLLVFFGILNTIGMSVYERIGEIGTMRALGDQRSEVLALLLCEGFCLGLLGLVIGTPFAWTVAAVFSSFETHMVMPGASIPVPVMIVPVLADYLTAGAAVVVTCFVSTLWPAAKAVRLSITDALRANS